MDRDIQDWYFTFGYDHVWPLTGTTLQKHYVVLRGTLEGTRREMIRRFDTRWAQQYASAGKAGVERFGLSELKLEHKREVYQ